MTTSAMSRPAAAQLSKSSEGRGKPVEGQMRATGLTFLHAMLDSLHLLVF
jgi:hypothetical protein